MARDLFLTCCLLLAACAWGCHALESREVQSTRQTGVHYFLPRVRLRLEVSAYIDDSGKLKRPTLVLKETLFEPDPEGFYRIDHRPSFFSADEISIHLTPEGLLERVSAVTDDKSDEIAIRIVETAGEIAKALAGPPSARVGGRREVVYEATVDPTDDGELESLNRDIDRFGGLSVKIRRRFPLWLRRRTAWGGMSAGKRTGVFFRPLLPYEMVISSRNGSVSRQTVLLPNEAPLFSYNVTRAAFVEKETTLEFQKGVLRKVTLRKPSEALALAGAPLEIARTLASLPGEILKLRVDHSSREVELAEARKRWFELQAALREAREREASRKGGDPFQ